MQTEHDTQPLVEEKSAADRQYLQFYENMIKGQQPPEHVHGPFTFIMNQNHNALRGCNTCGKGWVGTMAGINESDLRWHPVQEVEEEES